MQKATKELLAPQTITRQGKFKLSAQVTPRYGANLVSFKVNGEELIYWDPQGLIAGKTFTGAFNMWPTPCRLADCAYTFGGRRIVQHKRGEDVFIHGLIRDEELEWRNDGQAMVSSIAITPDHPVYEAFPFRCRFRVTHALHATGLYIVFEVKNQDRRNLPFGFGVHPFWRILGGRKQMAVRVPCDRILELKNLVPTGETEPVAGTDLDLRELRSIEKLYVDNAFWKRKPGDSAEVVFGAIRKRMRIEASANFAHMIVYAPPRKPFVCVENLTACPNAQNLATAGKGKVASLTVVAPGKTARGWIKYSLEEMQR